MKENITMKDVFTVAERPQGSVEGKDRWTKIGIGFVNRDNSINVVLDAFPTNGRLQIRDRVPYPNKQQPQPNRAKAPAY